MTPANVTTDSYRRHLKKMIRFHDSAAKSFEDDGTTRQHAENATQARQHAESCRQKLRAIEEAEEDDFWTRYSRDPEGAQAESDDAACADCGASASADDVGTTCRACGRGIVKAGSPA